MLLYGGFAESVGVKARVALLQAHAQCSNLAQAFGGSSGGSGGGSRAAGAASSSSSSRGAPAAAADGDDALGIVQPGCFSPNSTINNELCCSIVVKSQAPYLDMLLLLWWGLLLDYAAFSSPLPGVVQNHKSLLFGHTYPEVVEAVQGTYAAAWPAVLIAVASNLPGPEQLASAAQSETVKGSAVGQQQEALVAAWSAFVDTVSSGADLAAKSSSTGSNKLQVAGAADKAASQWHQQLQLQCKGMHAVLVDMCLMLLFQSAAACATALQNSAAEAAASMECGGRDAEAQQQQHQQVAPSAAAVAAARRVAVSLQALQLLLTQEHIRSGLVSVEVCCDVVEALGAVSEHVLLPWLQLCVHQQDTQHQQAQPAQQALLERMASLHAAPSGSLPGSRASAPSTAAAADKVFGTVLLSASELLHAVAAAACVQPNGRSEQAVGVTEGTAVLETHIVEALLALSSMAVPFVVDTHGASSNTANTTTASAATHASCTAAFTVAQQQQQPPQLQGSNSTASTSVQQPSRQAAAACSSLCRTAELLMQLQPGPSPGIVDAAWHLALRLVLTAAPGPQLQAAHKLLDSCLAACASNMQQDPQGSCSRTATACQVLCDAVAPTVQQLCGGGGASGKAPLQAVPDAAARLPVLLSGLMASAALSSSPAAAAGAGSTAAVDRTCGVLQWCLEQYGQPQEPDRTSTDAVAGAAQAGAALVVCKVLEALRTLLQDAVGQTGQQQQQGTAAFAQQCAAAVIPQVGPCWGMLHCDAFAWSKPLCDSYA